MDNGFESNNGEWQSRTETNWYTRNNSSNVSAVLNSELHSTEYEEIPVIASTKPYPHNKIYKCPCPDCYCTNSPVYPKLCMKMPEKYGAEQDILKRMKLRQLHRHLNINKVESTAYLDRNEEIGKGSYVDYTPETLSSKHFCIPSRKMPTDSSASCLPFTSPRKTYEEYRRSKEFGQEYLREEMLANANEFDRPYLKKLQEWRERKRANEDRFNDEYVEELRAWRQNKGTNVNVDSACIDHTHIGRQTDNPDETRKINENGIREEVESKDVSKHAIFGSEPITTVNLKKLNNFRKEHYFDCHSTENLTTEAPEHKCVHKFTLNHRLLPESLNPDPFGRSRCIICNKLMQQDTIEQNKSSSTVSAKQKQKKTSYQTNILKIIKGRSDLQIPNQINVTSKNDRIELTLPQFFGDANDLFCTNFKIKRPAPVDSLALRHQKRLP